MWLVGIIICSGWIFSLCLHEYSHAIVAYWGGDTSVKNKGYLTFNPLKYTDSGYSIILPLIFLLMGGLGLPGGAVYIDSHRLKSRAWDSAVAAAGPVANILLAIGFTMVYKSIASDRELFDLQGSGNLLFLGSVAALVYLQVFATVFNLLPIPGLDGYGIIEPWLPTSLRTIGNRWRKYSFWIIIGLFGFVPAFSRSIRGVIIYFTADFLHVPSRSIAFGFGCFQQPINRVITLVLLLVLAWAISHHQQKIGMTKTNLTRQTATIDNRNVSHKLRHRVEIAAKRDRQLIDRLLQLERRNNPGRSETWYWEKVLYYLERDLRR